MSFRSAPILTLAIALAPTIGCAPQGGTAEPGGAEGDIVLVDPDTFTQSLAYAANYTYVVKAVIDELSSCDLGEALGCAASDPPLVSFTVREAWVPSFAEGTQYLGISVSQGAVRSAHIGETGWLFVSTIDDLPPSCSTDGSLAIVDFVKVPASDVAQASDLDIDQVDLAISSNQPPNELVHWSLEETFCSPGQTSGCPDAGANGGGC